MNKQKCLEALWKVYADPKTDTYTFRQMIRALMDACGLKQDRAFLAELRTMLQTVKEVAHVEQNMIAAVEAEISELKSRD